MDRFCTLRALCTPSMRVYLHGKFFPSPGVRRPCPHHGYRGTHQPSAAAHNTPHNSGSSSRRPPHCRQPRSSCLSVRICSADGERDRRLCGRTDALGGGRASVAAALKCCGRGRPWPRHTRPWLSDVSALLPRLPPGQPGEQTPCSNTGRCAQQHSVFCLMIMKVCSEPLAWPAHELRRYVQADAAKF